MVQWIIMLGVVRRDVGTKWRGTSYWVTDRTTAATQGWGRHTPQAAAATAPDEAQSQGRVAATTDWGDDRLFPAVVTYAGCIVAGVGRAFSLVCLSVCLSVCPHSKRKTAWAIKIKLGTHILYSSHSHALTQRSKGQRSRSHGYKNHHSCIVASDACCYGHALLLAWVGMSIRLPVFSSLIQCLF